MSCVKGPLARNIVKLSYQARAALPAKPGVALGRLTTGPLEAGPLAALEREFGHANDSRYRHSGFGGWIGFGSTPA